MDNIVADWDKRNGDVVFYEKEHLYKNIRYPYIKYTSVTTLISNYYEHFDKEFWSSYGAIKNIMGEKVFKSSGTQAMMLDIKQFKEKWLDMLGIIKDEFEKEKQNILDEWDRKNKEACEWGTEYHLQRENYFYTKDKFKIGNLIGDYETEFVCEKHNFDLSRENAILPEYLIHYSSKDGMVNLSGQIDLLVKRGNDIFIYDYKSNSKGIDSKAFYDKKLRKTKKMKYPVNNLDDHTLNHYTLQLSLYAYMLQQINPSFNIKMLKLLHKAKDSEETEIEVPYLKDECKRIFIDTWKRNKIEYEKEILNNLKG